MFGAMIPVTFFLVGEWRYGHEICFNVYRGTLVVLHGLGVPRWTCYGWRCRQSRSFLIFGKWRFEFELSAEQKVPMFMFEHQTSGTAGPKGPNPGPKPKQSTQAGCLCYLLWCPRCRFFCGLVLVLLCLQRVEKMHHGCVIFGSQLWFMLITMVPKMQVFLRIGARASLIAES